ncbi:MAG: hypothetical protein ABSF79_09855 [Smithellaceae bacterium]|jgi:hypothetical protein
MREEILQISDKALDHFRHSHNGFLHLDAAKISRLLLAQLYYLHSTRIHSIYDVLDEIKYLEGCSKTTKTKAASQFRGKYLIGLWHKHFFSNRFLARNIINYWEMDKKGKSKLDEMIDDVFQESVSEYITDEMINVLSYRLTDELLKNRILKGSSTGEWIVFAKNNNSNHYLVLGRHGDDENICNLLNSYCLTEYPFIGNIIENKIEQA